MENPIKMDDLVVFPCFPPIFGNTQVLKTRVSPWLLAFNLNRPTESAGSLSCRAIQKNNGKQKLMTKPDQEELNLVMTSVIFVGIFVAQAIFEVSSS